MDSQLATTRRQNVGVAVRTWAEMRESIAERLIRQTGHDVAWWNDRVAAQHGLADESALRAWLTGEGVTGYQQMLLVTSESFGYPDFLLASADELLDSQYAGREQLRPILDAVVPLRRCSARWTSRLAKTYTSLLTPRRTFAAWKSGRPARLDVALRLDGAAQAAAAGRPEHRLRGPECSAGA